MKGKIRLTFTELKTCDALSLSQLTRIQTETSIPYDIQLQHINGIPHTMSKPTETKGQKGRNKKQNKNNEDFSNASEYIPL